MSGYEGHLPPPEIKLYWLDRSRSQRIVWLLEELQTPYELIVSHRDRNLKAPASLTRIHPLGKAPVLSIRAVDESEAVVLAESGFMTQYLCHHLPGGERLVPTRWREGREGVVGGETREWLRHEYLVHYVEGSLMPMLVLFLILDGLRSKRVPVVVRAVTGKVASVVIRRWIRPDAERHLSMLEGFLAESEERGWGYLCGPRLTAADILVSFPLLSAKDRWDDMGSWEGGSWRSQFPRVGGYVERLEGEDGYRRSVARVVAVDGEFSASL